jgi:hypothetical protein
MRTTAPSERQVVRALGVTNGVACPFRHDELDPFGDTVGQTGKRSPDRMTGLSHTVGSWLEV